MHWRKILVALVTSENVKCQTKARKVNLALHSSTLQYVHTVSYNQIHHWKTVPRGIYFISRLLLGKRQVYFKTLGVL